MTVSGNQSLASYLTLFLFVFAWYVSNTLSSVQTKEVIIASREEVDSGRKIENIFVAFIIPVWVTFIQLSLSGIIGFLYFSCTSSEQSPWLTFTRSYESNSEWFKGITSVAIYNVLGTLMTNIGYISGSVSFVQLIKAMEPVATVIAYKLLLNKSPNSIMLIGVILVISGSCFASATDASVNTISIIAALISNAVLPLRNIVTKKLDGNATSDVSYNEIKKIKGFMMFSLISSIGSIVICILLCFLYVFIFFLCHVNESPQLSQVFTNLLSMDVLHETFMSSSMYCAYNSFSFLVLGRLDPITHAILNVFKRAFNIITAMLFFHEPFTYQFITGLTIALLGLGIYTAGERSKDGSIAHYFPSGVSRIVVVCVAVIVFSVVLSQDLWLDSLLHVFVYEQ